MYALPDNKVVRLQAISMECAGKQSFVSRIIETVCVIVCT